MRILFLCLDNKEKDGADIFNRSIVKSLEALGHEIVIEKVLLQRSFFPPIWVKKIPIEIIAKDCLFVCERVSINHILYNLKIINEIIYK